MEPKPKRYQVVIVGGGPVGLGLAIELGQRGISCALVERQVAPQRVPKGQSLTNRSCEHFYFWGCIDELRAARVLPRGLPLRNITAYGDLSGPHWYAEEGGPGRGASVKSYFHQAMERLPQYGAEEVLRRRLQHTPAVTARFGWTATGFDQDAEGVRVTVEPTGGGSARVLTADFLVGCDGSRSAVREALGISRTGTDFGEQMVLGVFRSRALHQLVERFPEAVTFRVLKPELQGKWQFFGRVDFGEGWFFHAPAPKGAMVEDLDLPALMQQAVGRSFSAEMTHVGLFDLRISIADAYRRDRVFIAGDACHSHPPYGGFGLNTGLEDARNLGWKLAAALEGWGGEALLNSYEAERRPIFVETGELMIADGMAKDRDFLERYDPVRDLAAFEAAWARLPEAGGRRTYAPHYEGSPVVSGPPDRACSVHGEYSLAAEAGHHLAPAELSNGRNVYESFGPGFTLLAFGADEAAVAAICEAADQLGLPLHVVRDSLAGDRAAYGVSLILVRPDQHVAWAADAPPAHPLDLLRRVTGRVATAGVKAPGPAAARSG